MEMPGRGYLVNNSYRYGFNGKENDNEVKGVGNQQDYGMRIYDNRLGRFLSVDPYTKDYPWNTPYAYAENEPISNIDLDGLEKVKATMTAAAAGAKQYTEEKKGQANGLLKLVTSTEPYRNLWGYAKDWAKAVYGDRAAIQNVNKKTTQTISNTSWTLANGISQPTTFLSTMHKRSAEENIQGLTYYGLIGLELYAINKTFEAVNSEPNIIYQRFKGGGTYAEIEGQYLGRYEYSSARGLELDLDIPKHLQDKGLGSKIFDDAMFTTNAKKFTANWIESEGYANGASINLQNYRKALKKGFSEENAAWETWSGKQAKRHGFKNVTIRRLENGIQATFTK